MAQSVEHKLDMLRLLFGEPMEVFSSCLRNTLISAPGHTFDVADYSAIEARMVFWFADHKAGLKAYAENRPIYEEMAVKIFRVKLGDVDGDKRFVGKQTILGSGFGMGHVKFAATCKQLGKEVSEELAKTAIDAYRDEHWPVCELWGKLERAATEAVKNVGTKFTIAHTSWWVSGDFLWCRLPSGRKLAYHKPSVENVSTAWGDKRPALHHWGIDSKTKQWVKQKTWGGTLTENVVQATARDVMAAAMLRINRTGKWKIVLSVHDELISERALNADATHAEYVRLMEVVPKFVKGLPLKVSGWSGNRYRKD